ncbi:multicopper oxidase family protein [Caldalkalibacillus salinus]|uniref:multicopper oxidase family protein n=1 Tax=Caldalkalibacillus salinus TaxID=2803787 RepID=UPI0019205F4F|nr:multicopper oxidase family protein [Caldalkalibacillus salinus]
MIFKNRSRLSVLVLVFISLAASSYAFALSADLTRDYFSAEDMPDKLHKGTKQFTIEASQMPWHYNDNLSEDIWAYNNTLPGQELRVRKGDRVQVTLVNDLDVPTTLHFHGMPLENDMDGVPGLTQDPVMPGETFVYDFIAEASGTYWYHSHQDGAEQVGKGLYGALIVEEFLKSKHDIDYTVMIAEKNSMNLNEHHDGHGEHDDHGDMNVEGHDTHGMMDEDHHGDSSDDHHMDHDMYDTLILNGKAAPDIKGVKVKEGDSVRLRFVNTGMFTQTVSIPGHSYKITHYDGQAVHKPTELEDVSFRIAPAERYDIEIEMSNPGAWGIQVKAEKMPEELVTYLPIVYEGSDLLPLNKAEASPHIFDFTSYGKAKNKGIKKIDQSLDMTFNEKDDGTFTINGKQAPHQEKYVVNEGDNVKVTIDNQTAKEHPMHLHGHFFYVVSKNGQSLSGSPVLKDTLNVAPGDTYEIVFQANNPGQWQFHCHELHHSAQGMVSGLHYQGFEADTYDGHDH